MPIKKRNIQADLRSAVSGGPANDKNSVDETVAVESSAENLSEEPSAENDKEPVPLSNVEDFLAGDERQPAAANRETSKTYAEEIANNSARRSKLGKSGIKLVDRPFTSSNSRNRRMNGQRCRNSNTLLSTTRDASEPG